MKHFNFFTNRVVKSFRGFTRGFGRLGAASSFAAESKTSPLLQRIGLLLRKLT